MAYAPRILSLFLLMALAGCASLPISSPSGFVLNVVNISSHQTIPWSEFDAPQPFTVVSVDIWNNRDTSTDFVVQKHAIVYDDGTVQGLMGFDYKTMSSGNCYGGRGTPEYLGEPQPLFANAKHTYDFCFSSIDYTKHPRLVITMLVDVRGDVLHGYTGTNVGFNTPLYATR